jgi:glycosyltransferase involved in cell wall biosynthesis
VRLLGGSQPFAPRVWNAHCGNRASRRKRPSKTLWWNGARSLLADRRVGQFRREGHVIRKRRLENTSRTRFGLSNAFRLSRPPIDPISALAALLERVARRADDFDVIHCHLDWVHIPLLRRLGPPFVTTLHGRLDLPHLKSLVSGFADAPFISISNSQRAPLTALNWIDTIYHGLPERLLTPNLRPGSYLAFLGRFTPEKGAHVAIRLARKAHLPLRMAAKIPRQQSRYFKEQIEPLLDGDQVEFVGEVNERQKQDFLGNAMAVLFPIDWPEPFGLVMIEAMACGTPVIAWRRGSVPEIMEDGVTGFIVENEDEAINAIERIPDLDRRLVRAAFERRFTARQMAESYRRSFQRLLTASDRNIADPDSLPRLEGIQPDIAVTPDIA